MSASNGNVVASVTIYVDGNKFVVSDISGDVETMGTVEVGKAGLVKGNLSVNGNKFAVEANEGLTTFTGEVMFAGSAQAAQSLSVNDRRFVVAAENGDRQ